MRNLIGAAGKLPGPLEKLNRLTVSGCRTAICLFICTTTLNVPAQTKLPSSEAPTEWIDHDTGHRIIRVSREPNSESLYFNVNAFPPDGQRMVITSPTGLSVVNLRNWSVNKLVDGPLHVIMVGRKSGRVFYTKDHIVYATDLVTGLTQEIATPPQGGSVGAVNADETMLAGVITERPASEPESVAPPEPSANLNSDSHFKNKARNIEARFDKRWPMELFFLNLETGKVRKCNRGNDWLNHLQFSPADPDLLMFCHEGPWHKVDRTWTIRANGSHLTLIHPRTMLMEIEGHEFFGADGRMIWYDLQTPRGEDFWLGGYEVATAGRTWYHLQRNEWSVHFNVSPDGKLFCGDGGSEGMVAHAPDGKWIYLFHPEMVTDQTGDAIPTKGLIKTGVFHSEKLVNMARHDYLLEPNATFTPDMKWIVFRSNMHGPSYVYAVELKPAETAAGAKP